MNPRNVLFPALDKLKNFLKKCEDTKNQPSVVYSLGFGPNHDAELLNGVTRAGTQQGNFTYVRTEGDVHANIVEKLKENLSMALNAASNRLIITHADRKDFKISRPCQMEYIQPEEKKEQAESKDEK